MNVIQLLQLYFDKEVQLESLKFLKFLRIIVYIEVSPTQDFQLRASMHFFLLKVCIFEDLLTISLPRPGFLPRILDPRTFYPLDFRQVFTFDMFDRPRSRSGDISTTRDSEWSQRNAITL